MKVKEREKVMADKNSNEALEVIKEAEVEGVVQRMNGAAVDACKSENKASPSPALQQPAHEKMLYDTRIRRKNVLALNEKVAAIREYEKSPVYKRVGRLFHCSPDQIKRIVQQKDSILEAWQQRTRRCHAKTLEMKV
ncbi:PREDICTED: uncharacterized protein LOC108381453, partial [Rhagoletis zephyria]|uniref:uncharacterized protein LOC108381453 n=1 Tax=Rhagoletis zephyria TaxID=28612 RepID=UPI000811235A